MFRNLWNGKKKIFFEYEFFSFRLNFDIYENLKAEDREKVAFWWQNVCFSKQRTNFILNFLTLELPDKRFRKSEKKIYRDILNGCSYWAQIVTLNCIFLSTFSLLAHSVLWQKNRQITKIYGERSNIHHRQKLKGNISGNHHMNIFLKLTDDSGNGTRKIRKA